MRIEARGYVLGLGALVHLLLSVFLNSLSFHLLSTFSATAHSSLAPTRDNERRILLETREGEKVRHNGYDFAKPRRLNAVVVLRRLVSLST
jgi:hypothetical protein